MSEITFCIPIGLSHQSLAQRAIDSVARQTVPCDVLTMLDSEKVGPGVLRNRMLAQVNTPFVVFLDADDWVEPTFAEDTLAEWQQIGGNHYIFTDWLEVNGQVIVAPCINGMDGEVISRPGAKPYCGGTWHAITALIPTEWAKAVGGFDETLPAVEDTDFFLKLCTSLRCGHHLAKPLFHYSPGGGRAVSFYHGPQRDAVMNHLTVTYGGRMGCCGDNKVTSPIGEKQDGDVLAMALWQGNRSEHGRATGRSYPRISMPRTAWVDPRDVAASPYLWQIVPQPTVDAPQPITMEQMATTMLDTAKAQRPKVAMPINEPPPAPVNVKPDFARVVTLGKKAVEKLDQPIFIFPEKDYPSYSDIKRLVSLSGFDSITINQIDAFSRRPYIVVTPEPLPDLNGLRARVICWQLEYAGDYAHNYDNFKGEIWASDKGWADEHGAKYVLMGSHPDLTKGWERAYSAPTMAKELGEAAKKTGGSLSFDVTMLGYMTPRRQAIKAKLSDLNWPPDYPGHDTYERDAILGSTRLMLHVHQHENAPYIAPQRLAIAAAYRMPVVSETVKDAGDLRDYIGWTEYDIIPTTIREGLNPKTFQKYNAQLGDKLHNYLCIERPFRTCVDEALKG